MAWQAWLGVFGLGLAVPGVAWQASGWGLSISTVPAPSLGRQGLARRGKACLGVAWRVAAGPGLASLVMAVFGRLGLAGPGGVRPGLAGQGLDGQGAAGKAWWGMARHGGFRCGRAGEAGRGPAGSGGAGDGVARLGKAGKETQRRTKPVANVYVWRDSGMRPPVSAQAAGEELARVARANGGHLRPDTVVEESRPAEAPLHPAFEWDDPTAAHAYRVDQARSIIRSVHVLEVSDGEEPRPQIAYVHVTPREVGPCYMATATVLSDADLRDQAIAEALRLLTGVRKRFEHLEELAEVFAALERVEVQGSTRRPRRSRT